MTAAFAAQGFVFISLTTRLPVFAERWDLSDLELSGLLLMMVLLAGAGSLLAEMQAKRHSSARLLQVGLVGLCVGVAVLALAGSAVLFTLGLAVYGVCLGIVDAATNMQGVAIEHAIGRVILPSFHGAWTVGGILASGLTLAAGHLAVGWVALVGVLPLVVSMAPFWPRAEASEPAGTAEATAVGPMPWRLLAPVGAAMVLFYAVDVASTTWGPTFLEHTFEVSGGMLAVATFPYLVASMVSRLAGDALVARWGAPPLLRGGALLACAALALVVFAPGWPVAVLGFTLLGLAIAVIAPLSYSAAASIANMTHDPDPVRRQARMDAVIGRFNQFNYVGALVGSVLTGLVSSGNLRIGFAVPMVLVVALIPLARAFRPVDAVAEPV